MRGFPRHVRLGKFIASLSVAFLGMAGFFSDGMTAGAADRASGETKVMAPRPGGIMVRGIPEASKFYCGERIVGPGDTREVVLERCGRPAWTEAREEGVTERFLPDGTPVNLTTTEEWVYNFGSASLIRYLRFQGDRLAVIETGGYGYDDPGFGRDCGDGKNISRGDGRFDVLVKCGEPTETGRYGYDEWIYDFGPDRFRYVVKFRNGRVTDIRTGEYGE